MEELIHIPFGACVINTYGEIKKATSFMDADIHSTTSKFYELFSALTDTEVAYLYFLTIDTKNIPAVQLGIICDNLNSQNKLPSTFYAQYGIFAYSVSQHMPIHSFRIKNMTRNPENALTVLKQLFENSVAPSHITEVLESMNEKTPA